MEYPTLWRSQEGDRRDIFDLRKAAVQSMSKLAKRYLTTGPRCTFAWENRTDRESRGRQPGNLHREKVKVVVK